MLSKEQLSILTKDFPTDALGVKVQSFNKERTWASLVLYLQHTDVAARLDQADPSWEFKVEHEWEGKEMYYVKASLTVSGVKRDNVGEGTEPKGAYSDALKRCAMLFGVGRSLYDSEIVWVKYNQDEDKYRIWTHDDYKRALDYMTARKANTAIANKAKGGSYAV